MGLQLGEQAHLLGLVRLVDGPQVSKLVALTAGKLRQGFHILREAAAAESDPGKQK